MRNKLASSAAILVLLGIAAPAMAVTHEYTFTGSCDGLTLDEHGNVATGTHTGTCDEGDMAGGIEAVVTGESGKKWIITTTDSHNAIGFVEVFIIDQEKLTWDSYVENTSAGIPFTHTVSGTLTKGTPEDNAAPRELKPTFYR